VLPNLTLNAGVRYESQTLYTADHIVGQTSPSTGEPIPDKAFTLSGMLAPRVGVVYDWTKEGRSKVYGHYGRFYESIPMDINVRAYGGEVIAINVLAPDACDLDNPVGNCDEVTVLLVPVNFGGGETLVAPASAPSTSTRSCSAPTTKSLPTSSWARRTSAATSAA
jgi:hypothetical protein